MNTQVMFSSATDMWATPQSLISTDLPIMVDGKCVTEMTISYDNGFPTIELKIE